MHQDISRADKRGGRSRKRRRKRRIQLFLNFFMLVCIGIVIFCIDVLKNEDGTADGEIGSLVRRIEYIADQPHNLGDGTGYDSAASGDYDGKPEMSDSGSADPETVPESSDSDWELTLVNKWNPLPEGSETEIVELSNGERVDKRIYPFLQQMFDDARAAGIYPIVRSGYRTRQEQIEIYDERMQRYQADGLTEAEARTETELWVAVPGTSEHELGLAVDINADRIHSEGAEVYAWLQDHAHLYGFVNRYPSDKTEITGVANEPWHYRYVGAEAAAEIYERGICLEEYLADYHADDATLMHR